MRTPFNLRNSFIASGFLFSRIASITSLFILMAVLAFSSAIRAEGPPSLLLNDAYLVEGNSGATSLILTFTLSHASSLMASVKVSLSDGTAQAGVDYVGSQSLILSFGTGETNRTITLAGAVLGDILQEPNETFFINLSEPSNCIIARTPATVTIIDDDPLPSLHIQPADSGVRLLWPTNAFGFTLETSTNFNDWTVLPQPAAIIGSNFSVTNGIFQNNVFYRLNYNREAFVD